MPFQGITRFISGGEEIISINEISLVVLGLFEIHCFKVRIDADFEEFTSGHDLNLKLCIYYSFRSGRLGAARKCRQDVGCKKDCGKDVNLACCVR